MTIPQQPDLDKERIAKRIAEQSPAAVASDLENRLNQLKKDIETKGVATLFLQRGARNEVIGFTVLKSDTIELIPAANGGDPSYLQHVPGTPGVKLASSEILRIRVQDSAGTKVEESEEAKPKEKKK
jgi:hypothetical protein